MSIYLVTEPFADEIKAKRRKWANNRNKELRKQVLEGYGPVCTCCGEDEDKFLTIDHVNRDGKQHREAIKGQMAFYRWIIKNNFPELLQILCMNCNFATRYGENCPHQQI